MSRDGVDRDAAKALLEKHLQTRAVQGLGASSEHGRKIGASPGGIRQDNTHGYLSVYKTTTKDGPAEAGDHRHEWFREYISGPFYERILLNKAPVIELVLSPPGSNEIGLRSNFIEGLQPLASVRDNLPMGSTGKRQLKGFEKVIAACLFGGEADYHGGNIGVITDAEGHLTACKIDHGGSLEKMAENEAELRGLLAHGLTFHGHDEMEFDVNKFHQALSEVTSISRDEIDNIMQRRLFNLKQAGFQYSGYRFDTERLKTQLSVMQDLEKTVSVITKIDSDQEFKSGGWLSEINSQDPILWSMRNQRTIEGQPPLDWAVEHDQKILDKPALIWAIEQNKSIRGKAAIEWAMDNRPIIDKKPLVEWLIANKASVEGKPAVMWCIDRGLMIEGRDAFDWAMDNSEKTGIKAPMSSAINCKVNIHGMPAMDWIAINKPDAVISKLPVIEYAKKWGKKIQGKDAVEWAMDNSKMIAGKPALEWALDTKQKINGKPVLEWAIEKGTMVGDVPVARWASEKGLKIGDQDPVHWASEHAPRVPGAVRRSLNEEGKFDVQSGGQVSPRSSSAVRSADSGKGI